MAIHLSDIKDRIRKDLEIHQKVIKSFSESFLGEPQYALQYQADAIMEVAANLQAKARVLHFLEAGSMTYAEVRELVTQLVLTDANDFYHTNKPVGDLARATLKAALARAISPHGVLGAPAEVVVED